ncbi:MAG: DEAD/DEAH box helicase [Bacteroidales bacterium]|nr:DEAD/DEAH box helicase [Bacteroidales bacterium]
MGYITPTIVQEKVIPQILNNRDVIACAQTGTGKTAAYLLPIFQRIITSESDKLNTLIIAPTRELAQQIDQQVEGLGYFLPFSSASLYGGGSNVQWDTGKMALRKGTEIIIATPGRLISHLALKHVDPSELKHLILDEADKMLDMGFHEDIMRILSFLPKERQTLMFSATMPGRIRDLARKIQTEPEEINLSVSQLAEGVLQGAYMTYDQQKIGLIKHLVTGKQLPSILIFSATKKAVKDMTRELQKLDFKADEVHSDRDQADRGQVLRKFKNREIQILVATDVLSRGIDVEDIDLVINYDVPQDPEDYIHRVGRTARAEQTGVALTFITPKDQHQFQRIERFLDMEIRKFPLPQHLGEGPEYKPGKSRPGTGSYDKGKPSRDNKSHQQGKGKRMNEKKGNYRGKR